MTSEYVTLGHPDRTADYISEYILDRHLERDPNTRYALEVQAKANYEIINELDLRTPIYTQLQKDGLFSKIK